MSGPARVHDNVSAIHLFRIAQEAVNNAIKHGPAKHVIVCLEGDGEQIVLQVLDDGYSLSELR